MGMRLAIDAAQIERNGTVSEEIQIWAKAP